MRPVKVNRVHFWSHGDYIRVVVDLEAEARYKFDRLSDPGRLYFDLFDTRISPELAARQMAVRDDLLNRIRIAQTQDTVTRVVFDLNAGVSSRVSVLDDSSRVVVDLKGKLGAGQMAEVTPRPTAAPNSELAIASRILKANPGGAAGGPRGKSALQPNAPREVRLGWTPGGKVCVTAKCACGVGPRERRVASGFRAHRRAFQAGGDFSWCADSQGESRAKIGRILEWDAAGARGRRHLRLWLHRRFGRLACGFQGRRQSTSLRLPETGYVDRRCAQNQSHPVFVRWGGRYAFAG